MLGEFPHVSQHKDTSGYRRWFADEEMDLIVWYTKKDEIEGFQLYYDKSGDEHAFTWHKDGTVSHASVDQGEGNPAHNRTPILAPDGEVPLERVIGEFERRALKLDRGLAVLVMERLRSFKSFPG